MNQSIERFVQGGMLVLGEMIPAKVAARAMHERRVGSAVVCSKDGKMTGLITDRDLSNHVLAFGYSPDAPLFDFMTTEIFTITESADVSEAIAIMCERGVRRVPVVRKLQSGREKCVGMITLDDLISEKALDLETLSRIVSQQVIKRQRVGSKHERQRERAEGTLNRFYNLVSEFTRVERPVAEHMAVYLLSAIIQRLPVTGAVQMISQLPKLLQEDLLDLRAGVNRTITADTLLQGMISRFQMNAKEAETAIGRFWDALENFTSTSREPDQVLMQLPEDMRNLLS